MNENLPDEAKYAYFGVIRQCAKILDQLAEAMQILLEKRVTLEEKMIRSYFLELANAYASIAATIVSTMEQKDASLIEAVFIAQLTKLNEAVIETVEEFLKAARYDLNYLEQYFEFDFYGKLQFSDFKEKANEFAHQLSKLQKTI